MSDPTQERFSRRLGEIHSEIQKLQTRVEKAKARLEELRDEQKMIVGALQSIGAEIPEMTQVEVTKRRRGGRIRLLDAALSVVQPGEQLSKKEVASRVQDREIPVESTNLVNALATAMTRAPQQFKNLGRGIFKRVEQQESNAIKRSQVPENPDEFHFPEEEAERGP